MDFRLLRRVVTGLALLTATLRVPALAVFPDRPTNEFKSVGKILKADGSLAGSGVAIAPHWVISVAHVGGELFVEDGKQYKIGRKIFYKTSIGEPADLALFYIPETLKYRSDILDAAFDSRPNALNGQTVWLVGYGETCKLRDDGLGWQPVKGSSGQRRVATNIIDALTTDRYNLGTDANPKWHSSEVLVYDLDQPGNPKRSTLGTKITAGEGGVASKDSGGGWFVKVNGQEMLVAVSATVAKVQGSEMPTAYCYGGIGTGIYLFSYLPWIRSATQGS